MYDDPNKVSLIDIKTVQYILMCIDSNQCCLRGIDDSILIIEGGLVQPLTHTGPYSPGLYPQALPDPLYPPALPDPMSDIWVHHQVPHTLMVNASELEPY